MVDALCQRWGCPPSVILEQDAQYVLHMLWAIANGSKAVKEA